MSLLHDPELVAAKARLRVNGEAPADRREAETATVDLTALFGRKVQLGGSVLDAPAEPPAIWGRRSEVLWASGEPLLLAGPPGVGKTTLAGNLIKARVGIGADVFGYPVDRGGRVLYLACDRPRQIKRAFARGLTEADRSTLDEHLVWWEGPLTSDVVADPSIVTRLCQLAEADTVVIDSLKDVAPKLSDDDTGSKVNMALQLAVAEGIEVLALHHQRKAQQGGGPPKNLADVYGSTWITAGAGSVIVLWGNAGDAVIELRHLKQPADEIGPLQVFHDSTTGIMTVESTIDLATALANAPGGLTTADAARILNPGTEPSDNDRRKAQRRLDNLVKAGAAHRTEPQRGGDGGTQPARYYAIGGAR